MAQHDRLEKVAEALWEVRGLHVGSLESWLELPELQREELRQEARAALAVVDGENLTGSGQGESGRATDDRAGLPLSPPGCGVNPPAPASAPGDVEGLRPAIFSDELAALRAMPDHERLACLLCGGLAPGEASGSGDVCVHDHGPVSIDKLLRQITAVEGQLLGALARPVGDVEGLREAYAARMAEIGELEEALDQARDAIHRLCLERGSTEGYGALFDRINAALSRPPADGSRCPTCAQPADAPLEFGMGDAAEPCSDRFHPRCGRLLVGQGGDTYDPECVYPRGHTEPCRKEWP